MGTTSEIDRMLAGWGDRVFNGGGVYKVPPRRGLTGLVFVKGAKVQVGGSVGARAGATRRTLAGTAKKTPQVMVRIFGVGSWDASYPNSPYLHFAQRTAGH